MDELERLRKEIDEIDAGIVRLFEMRMAVTEQIGRYKQKNGLPVLDNRRQQEVLESKAALPEDPSLRADVVMLYETIMGLSRRQQRGIVREGLQEPNYARVEAAVENLRQPLEHPAVAYQGVPGAYSEQAAADFFGSGAEITGLPRFEDVFLAIREGRADYGVVPIENNSTGGIRQIYDLLARYEFYLVGETAVRVEHCLFGLHLIDTYGRQATVNIVESEKTALLMAIAYGNHQLNVWMACGGEGNLTRERLAPIINRRRRIILYPDRDGIEKWQQKAREIGYDLLTVDTTPVTKWWQESDGPKADIADVVIRHINSHTHIRSIEEEPAVRELIEKLDLEIINDEPK